MNVLNELVDRKKQTPEEIQRQVKIAAATDDFWEYCKLMNRDFFRPHRTYLRTICQTMQDMYDKTLINPETGKPYDILILNLPPGFGKSYTAGLFVSWCFGQSIKNTVITVSYNQTLSTRFAKTVRDMIEDKEIQGDPNYYVVNSFFPDLKIKRGDGAMNLWSLEGSYMSYLASSFDGSITGMRGNIGIIDDPIKNAEEAMNENVKAKHWDFYTNTFTSRMLDGAIQIIIQTRWATDDLAGRIQKEFPERCYVLKMPALKEDGTSLCEDLYSTADLLQKKKTLSPDIWDANYMQEPIDLKGALYSGFKTYDVIDYDMFERIFAYTDTADEGDDFLSQGIVGELGGYLYMLDVYHTDDPMEVTEKESARRLHLHNVRLDVVESNNGGRGFARNVKRRLKEIGNKKCTVHWFHQSKNKRTRILVNSPTVMERIIMPEGWQVKFPEFARAVLSYQRKGKNKHDDGPDMLTGLVEVMNGDVKVKQKLKFGDKRKLGM